MKKIFALLLSITLALCLPLSAFAETWIGMDFTVEVPEGMYTLGPNTETEDPIWALAGIGDPGAKLKEYNEMGVLADFISQDGQTSISLLQKESSYSKGVFDLALLNEEELGEVLNDLLESNSDEIKLSKRWIEAGGRPFYEISLDSTTDSGLHEQIYGTIVNGYALNFHLYTGGKERSQEQEALLLSLVNSIRFTNIQEKPEPNRAGALNTILLFLLLLTAVAGPLIYIPIRGKADKKRKARLAEQLSAYHRTHKGDTVEGEALFVNATDCTKEAIHQFSLYQAYVKNIGELVFGGVMCVVMLAAAFLLDTEWWMKLLSTGISAYYVYKIIAMPNTVEKIQLKVYGRGPSQTARYSFYNEVFRVSGIQSTSLVPYFQIMDVRRKGQYVYLYYGPENAYMVDQHGFERGSFEEFVRFIEEKAKQGK